VKGGAVADAGFHRRSSAHSATQEGCSSAGLRPGRVPIQATLRNHSRQRKHHMADFDIEALSLSDLKKMHKEIAKAITT
jgi:hypothetical protein